MSAWDNPELVSEFGIAARNRYLKYFRVETMIQLYLKVYREIVEADESF